MIKVNIDGSSIGNPGRSGFWGLLRNSLGGWIIGFDGSCGYTTNINVELRAISYGLQITWDLGFRDIVCESDFQTTLTFIKGRGPTYSPLCSFE